MKSRLQDLGDGRQAVIASDDAGGWHIAWMDERTPSRYWDIYVQRIQGDGTVAAGWPLNGVLLSGGSGSQTSPQIVADGVGGAIVVWMGNLSSTYRIHASRVNAAGAIAAGWSPNGTPITIGTTSIQLNPQVVSDGQEGAYIVWDDDGSQGDYGSRRPSVQLSHRGRW